METKKTCINCGGSLEPRFSFCPDCGQTTKVKRLTLLILQEKWHQ